MSTCKYKIKLGEQVMEFSSDEELNSFLNNNYNRLKANDKGVEKINFSKDFDLKEETVAKINKAISESNQLTVSYDDSGNKLEKHVNPNYKGVSTVLKDVVLSGKKLVNEFREDDYRAHRMTIDLVSFAKQPQYAGLSEVDLKEIINKNIDSDIVKWKMLAGMGTDIHAIAEQFFKYGIRDPQQMMDKMDKPFTLDVMGKYIDFLGKLHTEIKKLLGDEDVTILTEVKIHDEQSKVAGIIDLVAIGKNGKAHIYDFKTSHKKIEDWNNTKLNTMEFQMAFYTQLLASKGVEVDGINIVPFELIDIDYANNIVSDIEKAPTLTLKQKLVNEKSFSYIMRKAREVIPTSLSSLMSDVVESESIRKELNSAFDYNIAMKRVAASVEDFIKKSIKIDEFGKKYFYNEFMPAGHRKVVLSDDDDKNKVVIQRYLSQAVETSKNIVGDYKNKIKSVINKVEDKELGDFFNRNDAKNKTFQTMFGRYVDGMWEIVESADLDALGILLFRNRITNTLEVVSVTTNRLNAVVKLSKGKTILGNHLSDVAAKGQTGLKMLDSTNANFELIKVAMWLNDNYSKLNNGSNQDLNVGMIRVVNFDTNETHGAVHKDLLYSYKRLCAYTKTDYKLDRLKFANDFDLMMATMDNIINNEVDYDKDFRSKIDTLRKRLDIDDTAGRIQELIKVQSDWLEKTKIDTSKLDVTQSNNLQYMYGLINAALLDLRGISPTFELTDTKNMALNDSNLFSTISNMGSETVKSQFRMLSNAMQNIRITHTNFKEDSRHKYEDLFEETGLTRFRRYTVGDNISAYDNLYVKREGKITGDLMLKDPYNPNSKLKPAEREFLIFYLKKLNDIRYRGYTDEQIADLKESGNWFKVPLVRASSVSRFKNRDYKSVWTDMYNNALNLRNMFDDEHEENVEKANNMLTMYNQFAIDGTETGYDRREKVLLENSTSEFEQDLELVLDTYAMAHIRKTEYDQVLPFVHALKIMAQWNNAGYLNKPVNNLVQFMTDYVKTAVYNEKLIEPHNIGLAKTLSTVKAIYTKFNLGLSPIVIPKEIIQGLFANSSAIISKAYGKDAFDYSHYLDAIKILRQDVNKFVNGVDVVEELNHIYALSGMDINTIDEKMASAKTGALAFMSRGMMWASSSTDYFNRMSIFIAQMLKDGSYEAHEWKDNRLVYNWKKDDRYKVYASGQKSHKDYNYQRALYLTMIDAFNSETIGSSQSALKDGDDLPRAYTTKHRDSIKGFADSLHGAMDHESKIGLSNTLFGIMFSQFRNWLVAKKDKYMLAPNEYNRGWYTHLKNEVTGKPLYIKIDENGDRVTTDEITDWPVVDWEGKWQEGIYYSIKSIMKEGWDTRMDFEKMKAYLDENPVALANLKMMSHDLAIMAMLMILLGLIDFDELKGDSPYTAAVARTLLMSGSDLNPATNANAVLNPKSMFPAFGGITQMGGDLLNVISGDMSTSAMLTRDIGALRQFKHMIKNNEE